MSTSATPPQEPSRPAGRPDAAAPSATRTARRVPPTADLELMLALRGAARARDLRNRVVRPRSAETREGTGSGPAADAADRTRDLAHPN